MLHLLARFLDWLHDPPRIAWPRDVSPSWLAARRRYHEERELWP